MFDGLWAFLKDPANRAVLGWIGGGIVVVAGGVWAVVQFYSKKGDGGSSKKGDGGSAPSVRADRTSVAIGRDNTNSPIKIDTRSSDKR